ncbi:Leu/Ile/Val-binding protein homolog 5 [Durusdinium trenchii]|uniref:Leu/Ile/Val-binding protein homolog 5 n=1 Tax=Durusdinium trenchii TaxID=1381693 RepID=A0ABP0S825_9DINO
MELAASQQTPAQSIATIWDAGSSFAERLCAGATDHARRFGMKVVDATGIADQAMMPHMRQLKAMGPDLLVGCGNLRSAEQILISASSLSFVPFGLVLTAVSSRDAVRSVGAHLANYVMSPLVWEPSDSVKCPVFGSARDFATAYRAKFNEEPLPESAAAAAGGIALLAAIQAVSSLEQNAVRQALLSLSLQTCYGQLSFDSNGTRTSAETLTQQVQPLGKDKGTMDRWTTADIVTLGGTHALSGWPLPTWVQKEIDVYPCIPGEAVVLDNSGNVSTCKQCPPGQYRTPRSVECEECVPGTYGTASGMSQCDICPSGADCPGNTQVFAKAGFYRLPSASQSGTFVECNPRELCLGKNQCNEAHQGILCQHCEPGYSLPLWGLKRLELSDTKT